MEMYNGILRCEGTNIVDQDDKRFFPVGFGVGGALYPEGYMWQVLGTGIDGKKVANRLHICIMP